MIAQPEPKADVLARRDAIVARLRTLLPESGEVPIPYVCRAWTSRRLDEAIP